MSNAGFDPIEYDAFEPGASDRLESALAMRDELRADLQAIDESLIWLRAELRTLHSTPPPNAARPSGVGFLFALFGSRPLIVRLS